MEVTGSCPDRFALGNVPSQPSEYGVGGRQKRPGYYGKEIHLLPLSGIETLVPGHPAPSLVTI
jgi:hypothetical protein